jgi:anthranilate synthase/aminodeoxychorismate synthase-like glutamine amidotransferase
MLLMIDNYDSFTYNLVHYFCELGVEVKVVHNDQITVQAIAKLKPAYIVISPGPGSPNEAGISLSVIQQLAGKIPLLGVCLGHQAIAQVFGGRVVPAGQIMHGRASLIQHNQTGIFRQVPQSFIAARYHSLIVEPASLPACLTVTAWTQGQDNTMEIMGLRHRDWPIEGVQFHPESILSECGHQLLNNFLRG